MLEVMSFHLSYAGGARRKIAVYLSGFVYNGLDTMSCRTGVIPLDSTSDVAGPIARTVEDAVRLLEVTVGVDPNDNLTTLQTSYSLPKNYTQFLQVNGLQVRPFCLCSPAMIKTASKSRPPLQLSNLCRYLEIAILLCSMLWGKSEAFTCNVVCMREVLAA